MRFNIDDPIDRDKAIEHFNKLINSNGVIEISKRHVNRSNSQNNLLHTFLKYLSVQTGENLEYFKQYIWKMYICPDIFKIEYINELTDEPRVRWKSSAELDTKEMTQAIEKLRNWSSNTLGIELPDPDNYDAFREIEKEIENNRGYL